ncbi:MAG TPA: hypothetical protein VMH35_02280 [Streptosporangiaceae bacterium]|nr:hypothetical protein [Streptosporangiaceae bacterium]
MSTSSSVTPRNRLQPLATALTWVFWLAVAATAITVIRTLSGQGLLFGAHIGGPSPTLTGACVTATPALLQHTGSGLIQSSLPAGVRATWTTAAVCAAHPSFGQALASTIIALPIDLLRLGALYLAMRLARTAAADGVYTTTAARLVLILGWWLLAGGLVATAAQALARMNLLGQLVTWHLDWGQWPAAWSVSWPVVWIGLGLIIFARIMRIGAGMRADLEGTV